MANSPYTLFTTQANGPTLTAAAAASMLVSASPAAGQIRGAIPANWVTQGTMIQVRAGGIISAVVTTPGTARYDVRFGSSVVFDGLAVLLNTTATTNVVWQLEIDLLCTAGGSLATMFGLGKWYSTATISGTTPSVTTGPEIGPAILPWNTTNPAAGATFDATVPNVFDVFFTQTVATGSMTCKYCSAVILNPNY